MQTKNSRNDENRLDIQEFKLTMMPLLWFWSDNVVFDKTFYDFILCLRGLPCVYKRSGQGKS